MSTELEEVKRRVLTDKEKRIVRDRQSNRCAMCGTELRQGIVFDHVIPRKAGGSESLENFQALCADCDDLKTFGDGRPLSGDLSKIAKAKRLSKKQAEFREAMGNKQPGQRRPRKGTIRGRGFERRKDRT